VPQETASADVTRVAVQRTDQQLAGIVIGYHAKPFMGDPDEPALEVARTITGGYTYPTGYLFETLRGRGLVYVVFAQIAPGRDASLPGTFFVFAGCDPSKVNEVVDLILENIARVQGTPEDINVKWFNRSKELITLADALDHETPEAQASTSALDELYGLGYDFHNQFAQRIIGVTLPQVQSIARRRLRQCVVTISTPKPDAVEIKPGLRTYPSFPPVELTPRGIQHDTGGPK
jgi:zinc protease